MKRNLLILTLIILSLSSFAQKKNLIKTSLFFPLANTFDLSYERMISDDLSLVAELAIGEEIVGFSPQLRYYLSEDKIPPSGTFVSPFLMIGNEMAGGGVMVGIQRVFKDKVSLDVYLGPGLYTAGVAVWGGANIGIAF
jgi:hypothetical protein